MSFQQIIDKMPLLLEELNNYPMFKKSEIGNGQVTPPRQGIYVLFEEGKPIYVGRSNNIKQRMSGHSNQGSVRLSATFAFKLAIENYENKYQKTTKVIRRQDLETDTDFAILFNEAKARVAEMGIKVVAIEDQITQTIFEVYAAMTLGTLKYNSFANH